MFIGLQADFVVCTILRAVAMPRIALHWWAQASFIRLAGVPTAWAKVLKNVSAHATNASASMPKRYSSGGTWLAMAPRLFG